MIKFFFFYFIEPTSANRLTFLKPKYLFPIKHKKLFFSHNNEQTILVDDFPKIFHCSDASWNPKFLKNCNKIKEKKNNEVNEPSYKKSKKNKNSSSSSSSSNSNEKGSTSNHSKTTIHDLCPQRMSERQQLTVLQTIAELLEKEKIDGK